MSESHDKEKSKNESSEENDSINKLNINEEFAERFQHNEKRKKEEKFRNKYGINIKNREQEENEGEEHRKNPKIQKGN